MLSHKFSLSNDELRRRFLRIRRISKLGEQSANRASHIGTDRVSLCPIECRFLLDGIGFLRYQTDAFFDRLAIMAEIKQIEIAPNPYMMRSQILFLFVVM